MNRTNDMKKILKKSQKEGLIELPPPVLPPLPQNRSQKASPVSLGELEFESVEYEPNEFHVVVEKPEPKLPELVSTEKSDAMDISPRPARTREGPPVRFDTHYQQKLIAKRGLSKKPAPLSQRSQSMQDTLDAMRATCRKAGWVQSTTSFMWKHEKFGNMTLCTKDLLKMLGDYQICDKAKFEPILVNPTAVDRRHGLVWTRHDFQIRFRTTTLAHMLREEQKKEGSFSRLLKYVEAGFTKVVTAFGQADHWGREDCGAVFEAPRVQRMLNENSFDTVRRVWRMEMQLTCVKAGWYEGDEPEPDSDGKLRYLWRNPLFRNSYGVSQLYDYCTDKVLFPELIRK